MGPTAESIAHFVHGVVAAYFLTWTIFIWNLRKQSNMMYMLFLTMAYIAFCILKETVFLVEGMTENFFWSGLSLTVDIVAVPLVVSFFIELVSPGWVTAKKSASADGYSGFVYSCFRCIPDSDDARYSNVYRLCWRGVLLDLYMSPPVSTQEVYP